MKRLLAVCVLGVVFPALALGEELSLGILAWPAAGGGSGMLICPQTVSNSICYDSTNGLITFEGVTANAFETSIAVTDPFADTTFTIGPSPDGNPWLGAAAGDSASATEVDNVFIGQSAGTAASGTSTDNVAIGDLAADTLTTGDSNVIIGADADVAHGASVNTVVIGAGSTVGESGVARNGTVVVGQGITVPGRDDNVIVGRAASVTGSGGSSVSVGVTAVAGGNSSIAVGQASIAGQQGVAVGAFAETKDGVSIGYQAGDAQAAADVDNVFIGYAAGTAASGTSTDNVCVGDLACDSLTTGDSNVIIGADADVGATNNSTVAIGFDSIVANGGEIAIGASSRGIAAGTGFGVAIGYAARASDGVTIGGYAGDAQAVADVDNIFIGYSAGTAASGTSTDNTCVGDQACDALTTGDRNTLLGANTDVGTATDSDVTVIGESMVGKASDSILIGFGGQEHYYTHGAGKDLVAGGADEVFGLSIATITGTSATVSWNVVAYDATDAQSLAGMAVLWGINKADTEDCNMEELTAGTDEATSSGTLTAVPTWAAGTNECIFNLNAASSLTETTLKAYYTVTINGPATTLTLK